MRCEKYVSDNKFYLCTFGNIRNMNHPHWLIIPVFVYLFVFKTTLRLFVSLENFANFAYS